MKTKKYWLDVIEFIRSASIDELLLAGYDLNDFTDLQSFKNRRCERLLMYINNEKNFDENGIDKNFN